MKQEKIYEWEEFRQMLEYLEYDFNDICNYEEHYQNLLKPCFNLDRFCQYGDTTAVIRFKESEAIPRP